MKYDGEVACARSSSIKSSVQKVNLVAGLIRKRNIKEALLQLKFSKRRVAKDLLVVLQSAVANAENNFGYDIDKLLISRVMIGKGRTLRRIHPRAKGRAAQIKKHYSRVSVYLACDSVSE